jgi:hypothetical protein
MSNRFNFLTNEVVYHRIGGERLTVIVCDGCIAVVVDSRGETYPVAVGDLTRRAPTLENAY